SPPPPHLLGSGSKIPESQHARMCSQFSSPDPARFLPKKKVAPIKRPEEGSWIEHGRPAVSCSVYKSVPSTKAKEAEAQG
ncbi:hypothetical protein AAEI00_21875, partial [Shewanella algae]|uniref:hypothetical protein n=1 Tax=Shewanella algae TaxID=38313 RepID=UPI0031854FD0